MPVPPEALPEALPFTPVPFTVLLDDAVRWTRRYARAIYPPVAIPAAVLAGLVAAAQIAWQPSQRMAAADPWGTLARFYGMMAALVPYMLVIAVLYAAMTVAAVDAVAGRAVDVRRALRFVVRPRVLLTQLEVFFLEGVALLFCALPALYVWPLLRMTVPAMADEGVTGAAAIGRSAQLTHHNPRRSQRGNRLTSKARRYRPKLSIGSPLNRRRCSSRSCRVCPSGHRKWAKNTASSPL